MSNTFKIRTRSDGSYLRNQFNEVVVIGSDEGEKDWLSATQLDSMAIAEVAVEQQSNLQMVIEDQIANDPVIAAIEAGKAAVEAAKPANQLDEKYLRRTIVKGTEAQAGEHGHVVEHNEHTKIILLIEDGQFDNLEWDTSLPKGQKIVVLS